ncbi:hypothetical protein EU537_12240 [Candidatus Thorarchaeota archaeon]|nr:MAG: hypothetical protein EU537_12240 [Candidatus Thorarchaeota archaeon]
MTYSHKRKKCAKKTKEILDNVIRDHKAKYAFINEGQSIVVSDPMESVVEDTTKINVLPTSSEDETKEDVDEADKQKPESFETKGMENYRPNREVRDPGSEIRKVVQRDRKRRNYVNIRDEYENE